MDPQSSYDFYYYLHLEQKTEAWRYQASSQTLAWSPSQNLTQALPPLPKVQRPSFSKLPLCDLTAPVTLPQLLAIYQPHPLSQGLHTYCSTPSPLPLLAPRWNTLPFWLSSLLSYSSCRSQCKYYFLRDFPAFSK